MLRYAFAVAETSFDPAQITDLYSRTVTPHIFEAPVQLRPPGAAGQDQAAHRRRHARALGRLPHLDRPAQARHLLRRRPGVQGQAARAGRRRTTSTRSSASPTRPTRARPGAALENEGIVGLRRAARARRSTSKKPFDYDRAIEGLRALDRYTLQLHARASRGRASSRRSPASDLFGAVAREVVEFYGDEIDAHPVGTGPFKLAQWRRSSLIVLERNPDFREMLYDAEPGADDAEGQALLARFKGRRLPMIDRVEISIIEEEQPRWLAFLNGEADLADRAGYQFIAAGDAQRQARAEPRQARHPRLSRSSSRRPALTFFNMEDPVVGGYTPDEGRAAPRDRPRHRRRARDHAYVRRGQAHRRRRSPVLPHTIGYDPTLQERDAATTTRRARKALLDLYGYVDRDGDGWREQPDGSPLVLRDGDRSPSSATARSTRCCSKNMKAIGIRIEFNIAQWPENLKAARAGKLTDVARRRPGRRRPTAQGALPALRQPADRRPEHGALQAAGVRRALRASCRCCPTAPSASALFARGQDARASPTCRTRSTSHRIVTDLAQPLGDRLPPAAVLAGLVARTSTSTTALAPQRPAS